MGLCRHPFQGFQGKDEDLIIDNKKGARLGVFFIILQFVSSFLPMNLSHYWHSNFQFLKNPYGIFSPLE